VLGRVVTGGNVGETVGTIVGAPVGDGDVGDIVGVEVLKQPYTSSLDIRG